MADSSYYPPVGFYFSVSLQGEDEDLGFREVSGISQQIGVEEVASGGENRFKYRLPQTNHSQNLVLKRGMIPAGSVFAEWCKNTVSGALDAIKTKTIRVTLLNESNQALLSWEFNNAWPVKYELSDFHSQKNELVIESIELAYTYMVTVPNT